MLWKRHRRHVHFIDCGRMWQNEEGRQQRRLEVVGSTCVPEWNYTVVNCYCLPHFVISTQLNNYNTMVLNIYSLYVKKLLIEIINRNDKLNIKAAHT